MQRYYRDRATPSLLVVHDFWRPNCKKAYETPGQAYLLFRYSIHPVGPHGQADRSYIVA